MKLYFERRKEGSIYGSDWDSFSFLFALDKNQDVSVCRVVTSRSGFVVDSWRRIMASDSSRPAPNPASTWRRWAVAELLQLCRCVCVQNTAKVNPSSLLLLCFYSLSCSLFSLWRRRSYRSPWRNRYVVWRRVCPFANKSLFNVFSLSGFCSTELGRKGGENHQQHTEKAFQVCHSLSVTSVRYWKEKTQEENVFCLHLVGQGVQHMQVFRVCFYTKTVLSFCKSGTSTRIKIHPD